MASSRPRGFLWRPLIARAPPCWTAKKESTVSQSFTFIDTAGNQAQYTVYEKDRHEEFYWSTDYGDQGSAPSYAQAQDWARTALKASMAAKRRSDRAR
jgi:hypothetical protein